MIGDHIRTKSFQRALKIANISEKVILDAGCGLGILGFLALQFKAKKIIAADASNSINLAKKIAKINKFNNKIKFIQCNLKNLYLSSKVDVILHETIGNFLFDEDTVDIISNLRKNVLKQSGLIIPSSVKWYFAPVHIDTFGIYPPASFWSDKPYNIDFSPVLKYESEKPHVILLHDNYRFLSKPTLGHTLNYTTVSSRPTYLNVCFKTVKSDYLTGVISYFSIKLYKNIQILTSPEQPLTHWGQGFFPLVKPFFIKKNSYLKFSLKMEGINYHDWQYKLQLIK